MKKCLIIGGQNPKNFGSLMLVENYINYSDYDEFGILCENKDIAKIYSKVIKDKKLEFEIYKKERGIKNKVNFVKGLISNNFNDDNFQLILDKYDNVIFLGGDDLSEDYGIGGLVYQSLFLYKAKVMGKYVDVCGQTIGPFNSWRKKYMKYILKKVDSITSRDPISYKYLIDDMKLDKVKLTADLAFLDLKSKSEKHYIFDNEYVVICPSSIVWKYAKENNYERYIEYLVNIIKTCVSKYNTEVIILPHVKDNNSGDMKISKEILKRLENEDCIISKVKLIDDLELPVDARKIFKKSKFVITGRMHPAISTLSVEKPVLAISYSVKYKGVIGDYMGLNDYIVDVRNEEWDYIYKKTNHILEKLNNNYFEIVDSVKANIKIVKEKAFSNFNFGGK